jgi:hypothetical protein
MAEFPLGDLHQVIRGALIIGALLIVAAVLLVSTQTS